MISQVLCDKGTGQRVNCLCDFTLDLGDGVISGQFLHLHSSVYWTVLIMVKLMHMIRMSVCNMCKY